MMTIPTPTSPKRMAIIAAARKLFAAQGIDKTSINQIIAEAKTSTGNLYFFFTSKDELIRATMTQLRTEAAAVGVAIATQYKDDSACRIAIGCYSSFYYAQQERRLYYALHQANDAVRFHQMQDEVEDWARNTREALARIPDWAPGEDPFAFSYAWQGVMSVPYYAWLDGKIDMDFDTLIRYTIRFALQAARFKSEDIQRAMNAITEYLEQNDLDPYVVHSRPSDSGKLFALSQRPTPKI